MNGNSQIHFSIPLLGNVDEEFRPGVPKRVPWSTLEGCLVDRNLMLPEKI